MPKEPYFTDEFDYDLPPSRIAGHPCSRRDESSLLLPHEAMRIIPFHEIIQNFQSGDVLVRNTSRVFQARIFGRCARNGKTHEILLIRPVEKDAFEAVIHNVKQLKHGDTLLLGEGGLPAELEKRRDFVQVLHFQDNQSVFPFLESKGQTPLPPYIRRPVEPEDRARYQTVYAATPGSVAAPTAGLHFTPELLEDLRKKGVQIEDVVLHVGPGTFRPITQNDPARHSMHEETIAMPPGTARNLTEALRAGRRLTAVGTTTLRVLEACFTPGMGFFPYEGRTRIFIRPPQKVLSTHRLITNFHQPRSSLLMLVSAFASWSLIREAYRTALGRNLRFLSYGDAMMIENMTKISI